MRKFSHLHPTLGRGGMDPKTSGKARALGKPNLVAGLIEIESYGFGGRLLVGMGQGTTPLPRLDRSLSVHGRLGASPG